MCTPYYAVRDARPSDLEQLLKMRNPGPEATGSQFLTPQTARTLMDAEWTPARDSNIEPPVIGFTAKIPGRLGIIPLSDLNPTYPVQLIDAHITKERPEGSGFVEAVVELSAVRMPKVDFTTCLLDAHHDLLTFFPGPATPPSKVPSQGQHGRKLTVMDALALGLHMAKIKAID